MIIDFTNKWIESAVRKCLDIPEENKVTANDIEKIRYLRIGESLYNDFMIEISSVSPPEPFCDADGGDEWGMALNGNQIKEFLQQGENELLNPAMFHYDSENHPDANSRESIKSWKTYSPFILCESYYEEIEDEDVWEKWYDDTLIIIYKDLPLFTDLEVLRIQGNMILPNYLIFQNMKNLKTLELVDVCFQCSDGYEKLFDLQQFTCWLD